MSLILNFDINGTITAIDSTDDNLDLSSRVNMVVSHSIFGKIDDKGVWIVNDNPLNIDPNGLTYYYYNRKRGTEFRKFCYIFTDPGQPGEQFREYYDKIIHDMKSDKLLFDSFLKVLDVYHNAKLVLRTFGDDGPLIVNHLRSEHGYTKPFVFAKYIRSDDTHVLKLELDDNTISGLDEIGKFISTHDYNLCIKDDYKYWSIDNNRDRLCGKPMILNDDSKQIFFDDNDCIVTYENDPIKGLFITHNDYFNHINTISAMMDDEYYINIIKKFS